MFRAFRKHIANWAALPGRKRIAFLKASLVLLLVKTGLAIIPFSWFRKIFNHLTQNRGSAELSPDEIELAVWAVDTAANIMPLSLLCLPRALALKYLLRHGKALKLEIGVEINPNKSFEAHAWVEQNGTILIGDWPDSVRYQRLWVWN